MLGKVSRLKLFCASLTVQVCSRGHWQLALAQRTGLSRKLRRTVPRHVALPRQRPRPKAQVALNTLLYTVLRPR